MFDPEVVYDVSQVRDWPDQPMFKGLDCIREMALNWYASWEFSFELRELHDLGGDRCLLLSEFRMTGAGSGVPLDHVGPRSARRVADAGSGSRTSPIATTPCAPRGSRPRRSACDRAAT